MLTIVQGDVRQQVLLQVTDLASYAMVTETRTVAWVNSLATGQPVVGATVEVAGDSLGRTGADGTRTGATPDAMLTASTGGPRYMVVRDSGDRSMFVPLDTSGACGKCDYGAPADYDGARRVVARARRRAHHVALDRPCQRLGRRPRS